MRRPSRRTAARDSTAFMGEEGGQRYLRISLCGPRSIIYINAREGPGVMRGLLLGLVGLSLIVALLGLGSAMTCGGQVSLSCLEATLSLVSPDFLWNFEAVRFTAEQGVLPEAVPHYDPFHCRASLPH